MRILTTLLVTLLASAAGAQDENFEMHFSSFTVGGATITAYMAEHAVRGSARIPTGNIHKVEFDLRVDEVRVNGSWLRRLSGREAVTMIRYTDAVFKYMLDFLGRQHSRGKMPESFVVLVEGKIFLTLGRNGKDEKVEFDFTAHTAEIAGVKIDIPEKEVDTAMDNLSMLVASMVDALNRINEVPSGVVGLAQ
jgi:hypothetical protein